MLYRFVRPMFRDGSQNAYFYRRIPANVLSLARGLQLTLPVGEEFVPYSISAKANHVRFSLRTSDPREVKARTSKLDEYFDRVWAHLRESRPVTLTHREAVALAGELYRAWAKGADERRERTYFVTLDRETRRPIPDETNENIDATPAYWAASWESLERLKVQDEEWQERVARGQPTPPHRKRPYEEAFGPIVDALLARQAIMRIHPASREMVLEAFRLATLDAMAARERNASGDYSPDPKADRFPALEDTFRTADAPPAMPAERSRPKVSLRGLYDDWWKEAKAAGRTESTRDSYSRTFRLFGEFLAHDDASRVSTADVQRFKEHRREQGASIKTVKDSDLSALKSVFAWAAANGRLKDSPATNVRMLAPKQPKVRERAFTDEEARSILRHANTYEATSRRETPKVAAAKRWIPWLCAYSGARLGEVVQLRKQDVSLDCDFPHFTITPEAGTVKSKEARHVVIHEHLVALGFLAFVRQSEEGYLFLNAKPNADADAVQGLLSSVKNRLADFVREVVTDKRVAPNHGWRHTFKTIGSDADMREKVLDAICGHSHKTEGRKYGHVKLSEQAREMAKFPRYNLEGTERD